MLSDVPTTPGTKASACNIYGVVRPSVLYCSIGRVKNRILCVHVPRISEIYDLQQFREKITAWRIDIICQVKSVTPIALIKSTEIASVHRCANIDMI